MKRIALILALELCAATSGHAVQILSWERLPLSVSLIVGQERVVFVDRKVRVGLPPSLGDRLRVQSADGAIYLRASTSLPPTRVELQDTQDGSLILLDVSAQTAGRNEPPLEPIRIVDHSAEKSDDDRQNRLKLRDRASTPDATLPSSETPIPVALTRYAAQSLYAPLRTVEPVNGIAPAPFHRLANLDTLLPTLPVRARALAAWRLENDWVTAVQLTNTSDHWLALDPRLLQGDFQAATFQHRTLGPHGQSTDTTVLYLVTYGHGLGESLLPAIAPVDPSLNLPAPTTRAGVSREE